MLLKKYDDQLFPNQEAVDKYVLDTEEYAEKVCDEESALALYKRIALLETVSDFFFVPKIVFSWEEMALSYVESERGKFKSFQYENMKQMYARGVEYFATLEKNVSTYPEYYDKLFHLMLMFNVEIRIFNEYCVKYDEPTLDTIQFSDMMMQQKYCDWKNGVKR